MPSPLQMALLRAIHRLPEAKETREFSAALRAWRLSRGWTMRQAWTFFGAARRSYMEWESGEGLPRPERLAPISRAIARNRPVPLPGESFDALAARLIDIADPSVLVAEIKPCYRIDWRAADWSLSDLAIAASLGVTRSAASQARRRYAPQTRRPRAKPVWSDANWALSDSEIARELGTTRQAVWLRRRKISDTEKSSQ